MAESHTAAADAIRLEIAEQLAAGRSVDEVRQHFVDRYGQWILLQPADPAHVTTAPCGQCSVAVPLGPAGLPSGLTIFNQGIVVSTTSPAVPDS